MIQYAVTAVVYKPHVFARMVISHTALKYCRVEADWSYLVQGNGTYLAIGVFAQCFVSCYNDPVVRPRKAFI
jgi:hypothetical protein